MSGPAPLGYGPAWPSPPPQRPPASTPTAAAKTRDPWFDNAKMALVLLVVVGHAWTLLPHTTLNDHLYDFLYAWHVPAFVLVTGYLSRSFTYEPRRLWQLVRTVAVPYVVFECALALFRIYVGGEQLEDLFRDPHWPMWYLVGAVLLAAADPGLHPDAGRRRDRGGRRRSRLVAGLYAGDTLDLARVLGLLPFFVLGLTATKERLERLREPWVRNAALVVFLAIAVVTTWTDQLAQTEWLYYRSQYGELDVGDGRALLTRAVLLVIGDARRLVVPGAGARAWAAGSPGWARRRWSSTCSTASPSRAPSTPASWAGPTTTPLLSLPVYHARRRRTRAAARLAAGRQGADPRRSTPSAPRRSTSRRRCSCRRRPRRPTRSRSPSRKPSRKPRPRRLRPRRPSAGSLGFRPWQATEGLAPSWRRCWPTPASRPPSSSRSRWPGTPRCWPRRSTRAPTPATRCCCCSAASASKREATPEHPFGFGRDRYIYSFIVAIVLFSVGGLFALYEAYHKFHEIHSGHSEAVEGWKSLVPVVVLVVAIAWRASRCAPRSSRPTRSAATRRSPRSSAGRSRPSCR